MIQDLQILRIYIQALLLEYGTVRDTDTMHCACAIASYFVFMYLEWRGYKPMFVKNSIHCWIRVGEYTVDLTAKQFDDTYPEVMLIFTEEENGFWFYEEDSKGGWEYASSGEEVLELVSDWIDYQNPAYILKKLSEKGLDIIV